MCVHPEKMCVMVYNHEFAKITLLSCLPLVTEMILHNISYIIIYFGVIFFFSSFLLTMKSLFICQISAASAADKGKGSCCTTRSRPTEGVKSMLDVMSAPTCHLDPMNSTSIWKYLAGTQLSLSLCLRISGLTFYV